MVLHTSYLCWYIIDVDVCKVLQQFFLFNRMLHGMNSNFIYHRLTFSIIKFQLMYLIFIDEDGVSKNLKVKVKDARNLPNGLLVVVNYDDKYKPIGEAPSLLAGVCGQLATNCILFPISFERWSSVPDTCKDKV